MSSPSPSSSAFEVREHVIDAQHVREYPRATASSQDEALQLAVKQYIPKNNPSPQPGDVTILASPANGFPKELYEPMWEDLLAESEKQGFRIRGIWIADVAWQGQSGILNESKLGNDPSWYDHARDLLHLVNHFRALMPRPLVGIGHSFGATVMVNLALMHPRLLTTLVLIDPVAARFDIEEREYGFLPMSLSAARRDLWPSRAAAADAFNRSGFYRQWDPRVLARWNAHGLRETPTPLYPGQQDRGKATLLTTKHQEVFTYMRPQHQGLDDEGRRVMDRAQLPDMDPAFEPFVDFPFYRPEGITTSDRLPSLRPGALYLFGADSQVCPESVRREKMETTGVGVGGSGGAAKGRVAEFTFEGRGHLVAMEVPGACARQAAAWMGPQLEGWRRDEAEYDRWARMKSLREKQTIDEQWMELVQKRPKL